MKRSLFLTMTGAALAVLPVLAQEDATPGGAEPRVTIKEVMEKTITPASNTLWYAFEPPADEAQWLALEEAAVTMLVASTVVAIGGTGPMDMTWAADPAWQTFNGIMIEASRSALEAVRARDHDALLAAGEFLYPPCEGCHQQFNPGVAGRQ